MKKAQVTVYIIIGLVLVIGIALVMLFALRQSEPLPEKVPDDIKVVQEYVLQCVRNTAEEGLVQLGEHGGYIDPTDAELSGRSFDLSPIATQSDVLYINDEHAVPYWWYMKTPLQCTECIASDAQMPTIEAIEKQLGTYIEKQIVKCLSEFRDFDAYTVTATGNPVATVAINSEDVSVLVQYPISVKYGDKTTTIETFPATIELDFLEIYTLAVSLTRAELESQYLETILMHLVSAYSDLDPTKLPPIAAFNEGYSTVVWSKTVTKTRIAELLKSYIPFIQLENSKDYEPVVSSDTFQEAMYRLFTLRTDISYQDINVDYFFLDWPIDFEITPRSGELLKPSTHKREFPFNILPEVQTNHYEFFYDVAYPVVIELRNDIGLDGRGYSFLFALEGNVIDNKNLAMWHVGEGTFGPLDLSQVKYSTTQESLPIQTYIPETDSYVNVSQGDVKKLFCDENQRISGDVLIEVLNSETNKPIADADIIFGCGKYTSCNIGSTSIEGKYSGKLPICIGEGYILVQGTGITTLSRSGLSIRPGQSLKLRLKPDPLHVIDLIVKTIMTDDVQGGTGSSLKSSAKSLEDSEQVFLTVTRVKKDPFEPIYSQVVIVEPDTKNTILLSEGSYTIDANLIDVNGILIPEHQESVAGTNVVVPEIKMKPAPIGGSVLDDSSPWVINKKHLAYDTVTFYMLKSELPTTMQDLQQLEVFRSLSAQYPQIVKPVFR